MKIHLIITVLIVLTSSVYAELSNEWLGPKIDSIEAEGDTTVLDVVNQIREVLVKDKKSRFILRIDVDNVCLAKCKSRMLLKNVPALVALQYAAEQAACRFEYEDGIWIMRNRDDNLKPDVYTVSVLGISDKELSALGLKVDATGSIKVAEGIRWPSEMSGKMTRVDKITVLRAYHHEIKSLTSLLHLYRRGYKIPHINKYSEQGAASDR